MWSSTNPAVIVCVVAGRNAFDRIIRKTSKHQGDFPIEFFNRKPSRHPVIAMSEDLFCHRARMLHAVRDCLGSRIDLRRQIAAGHPLPGPSGPPGSSRPRSRSIKTISPAGWFPQVAERRAISLARRPCNPFHAYNHFCLSIFLSASLIERWRKMFPAAIIGSPKTGVSNWRQSQDEWTTHQRSPTRSCNRACIRYGAIFNYGTRSWSRAKIFMRSCLDDRPLAVWRHEIRRQASMQTGYSFFAVLIAYERRH